jgi:hypothetical protein
MVLDIEASLPKMNLDNEGSDLASMSKTKLHIEILLSKINLDNEDNNSATRFTLLFAQLPTLRPGVSCILTDIES